MPPAPFRAGGIAWMAKGEAMATAPITSGRERSLKQQQAHAAFRFLAPMLLMLFFVAAWPLGRSIRFSVTDRKLDNLYGGEWVGFDNYLRWPVMDSGRIRRDGTLADPDWWKAVWNTVRFAAVSVFLETVPGLMVALVLNAEFKGRGFARAARNGDVGGTCRRFLENNAVNGAFVPCRPTDDPARHVRSGPGWTAFIRCGSSSGSRCRC